MDYGYHTNGHDEQEAKIDVTEIADGCVLFTANDEQPPPEEAMPFVLAQVLQRWIEETGAHVRETLPISKGGNTIALFVWWDQAEF